MTPADTPGQIVILNGTPRAGKSSIATAIQETFDGLWMNLGVDAFKGITPERYQPAIGLRPGGERPDLEPLIVALYAAMYESIAAHSRLGLNAVVDVGHHDSYATPRGILADCARRLDGLADSAEDPVPDPVRRWQREVHIPGIYDLEVDTSQLSPAECATTIRQYLDDGPAPTAFQRLAGT